MFCGFVGWGLWLTGGFGSGDFLVFVLMLLPEYGWILGRAVDFDWLCGFRGVLWAGMLYFLGVVLGVVCLVLVFCVGLV